MGNQDSRYVTPVTPNDRHKYMIRYLPCAKRKKRQALYMVWQHGNDGKQYKLSRVIVTEFASGRHRPRKHVHEIRSARTERPRYLECEDRVRARAQQSQHQRRCDHWDDCRKPHPGRTLRAARLRPRAWAGASPGASPAWSYTRPRGRRTRACRCGAVEAHRVALISVIEVSRGSYDTNLNAKGMAIQQARCLTRGQARANLKTWASVLTRNPSSVR